MYDETYRNTLSTFTESNRERERVAAMWVAMEEELARRLGALHKVGVIDEGALEAFGVSLGRAGEALAECLTGSDLKIDD
jgi:hypothetical protein